MDMLRDERPRKHSSTPSRNFLFTTTSITSPRARTTSQLMGNPRYISQCVKLTTQFRLVPRFIFSLHCAFTYYLEPSWDAVSFQRKLLTLSLRKKSPAPLRWQQNTVKMFCNETSCSSVSGYHSLELTCYLHVQSRTALLWRQRKRIKIEVFWDVTPYILVDVNLLVEPAASAVMVDESNCGCNGCSLGQDGLYFTR